MIAITDFGATTHSIYMSAKNEGDNFDFLYQLIDELYSNDFSIAEIKSFCKKEFKEKHQFINYETIQ